MSITLADFSVSATGAIPTGFGCGSDSFFRFSQDEALFVKSGKFAILDDCGIKAEEKDDVATSILVRSRRLLAQPLLGLAGSLNAYEKCSELPRLQTGRCDTNSG